MDDLISRKAMLEALGHFNDYINGDKHFLNGIETAKEIAENLPAVNTAALLDISSNRRTEGDDTMELNWRNKPPTEKQLAYIMRMQEDAGMNGAIPLPQFTGKTRGEASDYINTNNGKQFKSFDYDSHGDNYGDRI